MARYKILVFTPHDEHSQGEHPHNSFRSEVDDKIVAEVLKRFC